MTNLLNVSNFANLSDAHLDSIINAASAIANKRSAFYNAAGERVADMLTGDPRVAYSRFISGEIRITMAHGDELRFRCDEDDLMSLHPSNRANQDALAVFTFNRATQRIAEIFSARAELSARKTWALGTHKDLAYNSR